MHHFYLLPIFGDFQKNLMSSKNLESMTKFPSPGCHSSEITGLCLMKCSNEMIKILPYFWNTKTYDGFCFPKIWQILKHSLGHFIKHKPVISKEWYNVFSFLKFQ